MRCTTLTPFLFLFLAAPALGQSGEQPKTEKLSSVEAAALDVVVRGYIDGLHRNRDVAAVREAFHPRFVMHVVDDDSLIPVPLQFWLDRLDLDGTKNPSTIEYTVESVDVTGNTATVSWRSTTTGTHIYTDYFGLYRFGSSWKIVNKIFYDHD